MLIKKKLSYQNNVIYRPHLYGGKKWTVITRLELSCCLFTFHEQNVTY